MTPQQINFDMHYILQGQLIVRSYKLQTSILQYHSRMYAHRNPEDEDPRNNTLLTDSEQVKVEIYFSIKEFSASSLYLKVYLTQVNKPREQLLKTKPSVSHNGRFDFPQSLIIDYGFQVKQKIQVQIYDASGKPQIIGESTASVGEIFHARTNGIDKKIMAGGTVAGLINLRLQKIETGTKKFIEFTLFGRNVDVGHYCCCSGEADGFWRLYKVRGNENFLLFQSEEKAGKDTRFISLKLSKEKLCNNNDKQPIIFRYYSNSLLFKQSLVGQVRTNMDELYKGHLSHKLMDEGHDRGTILLEDFKQTIKYDFTDYLTCGMQMAMVVCIDFTASNGHKDDPKSLHYITPTKASMYEEALREVCNIVLDYDTDKFVPTYGFGAKVYLPNLNTGGKVHHCFPINGSKENPNFYQLDGIMKGYRDALHFLQFSGPTYFAPLLRQAMKVCRDMKRQLKQYMILLILTDGAIHDKEEVMDLLVKCGRLPLSIIMIGIGDGSEDDWKIMHQIDDDDCLMVDFQGNKTQRDLVQFVEFSKHNNDGVELAKEVLWELPRQVQEYHQLVGLTPDAYKKNFKEEAPHPH